MYPSQNVHVHMHLIIPGNISALLLFVLKEEKRQKNHTQVNISKCLIKLLIFKMTSKLMCAFHIPFSDCEVS